MEETAQEEIVRGTIERVTFKNPTNGYTVLQVHVPDTRERLTVVGTLFEPVPGVDVVVRGTYIIHPKFGRQVQASSITKTLPASNEGFQKFLSSGIIKGIGEKTAERIVEHLGDKALEVIHRSPDKLARVPGVGKHKADLIHEALISQQDMGAILQFLIEHGISPKLAARIYEKFGNKAVEIISKDPYILARALKGVGFITADTIALQFGLEPTSPQRIKAGLFYALEKASEDGHCFLSGIELANKTRTLLGLEEQISIDDQLASLISENFVIEDDDAYYLKPLHTAESFVAAFIASRINVAKPILPDLEIEYLTQTVAQEMGITFSVEQKEAVCLANRYPFVLITGGPGSGKTTVIRALTTFFEKAKKSIALAAPTGRAAQRMSQVTSMSSSTIHRLLRYDPSTGGFLHGINQPLIADVIIIDEASMIDILLAKDLFSAVDTETIIILVGDKDQLPSVGPGRVFADLLTIKEIPSIALNQVFRREDTSSINTIAQLINAGIDPTIPAPDGVTKADAYFIAKQSPEETASLVEKLISDQIPKKFGFEQEEILVLTPSNRGPLGTLALNTLLQEKLNPINSIEDNQEILVNQQQLRVRDKVCQRVNNYNIDTYGVYNGDNGVIVAIDKKENRVVVELWDGRLITYEGNDLSQLSLAYTLTVHRSQGSESPCVVLVLDNSHYTLLERQLLYTAVTRAKKLLIIVGSRYALAMAVKRTTASKRNTAINGRVKKLLQ